MEYQELRDFIENKMQMSHIYQPAMLIELLKRGGISHQENIAKALLSYDTSQIEYYTQVTNNMVGRVLRNRGVVVRNGSTKEYSLTCNESLTQEQRDTLLELCKVRLLAFIERRGDSVYNHRKKSEGYISGTIRYEVLKRARFRCELCGISADEKALEVDHIVPRIHGGVDDISNFQALCYSCNAMKRDRDDTDLRRISESYQNREEGCLFCEIPKERIITENELAYVIRDGYPVTQFHTLVIPKRHVESYFDLGQAEINAVNQLLQAEKKKLETSDSLIEGFNVGINCGEVAGQTIFHCHAHLIPRRRCDVEDPRGGVRSVIQNKANYLSEQTDY